ncbi:MAG: FAD-binding oxidoreductase [Alphaproteobacteria bacterium]|nr:FAD-binding oxidoreductase [Alphaproteobacteria bacterium]
MLHTDPSRDDAPLSRLYQAGTAETGAADRIEDCGKPDAIVVGAGITGLSTALRLAEQGIAVVVLEARHIAAGASGRAVGQVVPYAKNSPAWILKRFGAGQGKRIVDFIATGPDAVNAWIERYAISCEPAFTGGFLAAHAPVKEQAVIDLARYWSEWGAPARIVRDSELAAMTGSSRYRVAMLDDRVGTVNVLGYTRGLARAARSKGARIVENWPVRAIEKSGDRWVVRGPQSELSAASLVIATNAYSDKPWPALGRSILPVRTYQLITSPVPEALRRKILPGGQTFMDTRRMFSSIRLRPDGRLHVSCDGPPFDRTGRADRDRACARAKAMFPDLPEFAWDDEWSGWVDLAPSQFPGLHRLDDGLWAALGYSGRGIAMATLLGREIAQSIIGGRNDADNYPVTAPTAIPSRLAAALVARALIGFYRWMDRFEMRALER